MNFRHLASLAVAVVSLAAPVAAHAFPVKPAPQTAAVACGGEGHRADAMRRGGEARRHDNARPGENNPRFDRVRRGDEGRRLEAMRRAPGRGPEQGRAGNGRPDNAHFSGERR